MPLITDPTPRNQSTYGKFKPKSDLKKWGVRWADLEGGGGSYPSFSEITSLGDAVGSQGRTRLVYEEALFGDGKNAKPNDIKVGGRTLREVRAPIEEIREADRIAAEESNDMLRQFHKRPEVNRVGIGTGHQIEELTSKVEDTSKHLPDTDNTPVT